MKRLKKALIIGINCQLGFYLSQYLIRLDYEVMGTLSNSSKLTGGVDVDRFSFHPSVTIFEMQYHELGFLERLIKEFEPGEIYGLEPLKYDLESTKRWIEPDFDLYPSFIISVLELICSMDAKKRPRFLHACQYDLLGMVDVLPQGESTPHDPQARYAKKIEEAYQLVVSYREKYGIHVTNGIFFDHSSPSQNKTSFVRNVTRSLNLIAFGEIDCMEVQDLAPRRDRSHAEDFVRGMVYSLQKQNGNDYVFASGISTSREIIVYHAAKYLGMTLRFEGKGSEKRGYLVALDESVFTDKVGDNLLSEINHRIVPSDLSVLSGEERKKAIIVINSSKRSYNEPFLLLGDYSKAKDELHWSPNYHIVDVVSEMMQTDLNLIKCKISNKSVC